MADAPGTLTRIRIVKLQFCHNDTCRLSSDPHLEIKYDDVELSKSLAVALSYTWGEFDRRDVFIGHDTQGTPVSMNLGQEWDVQDTIVRLAMLCMENSKEHGPEHTGLWIDQLCIRQNNAEIRATLASIPTIYRTLEVVALMPGGLCSCLQQFALPADPIKVEDAFDAYMSALDPLTKCANAFGLCSYFDRVWTRQELLYCRSIRVAHVASEVIDCALGDEDSSAFANLANLSNFANELYTKHLREDYRPQQAYVSVVTANANFFRGALESLSAFRAPSEKGGPTNLLWNPFLKVVDFLLGRKLTRETTDESKLDEFSRHVRELGMSSRKATKACDYVASVWVDCPGYVLPDKYKEMCLPSLLEDAIRQLEAKHGVTFQVSAFAGLLGQSPHQSGLWKPMTYLRWRSIGNAAQLYRTIMLNRLIPVKPGGVIPLSVLSPIQVALSQVALEYSELFPLAPSIIYVLNMLQPIFQNFTDDMHTRFRHSLTEDFSQTNWDDITPSVVFFLTKLVHSMAPLPVSFDIGDPSRYEGLDHHQLVYKLVAISLGLDPSSCQSRGLKLIVVVDRCIGLVAPDILENGRDVITISTSELRNGPGQGSDETWGEPMLEAVKIADKPFLKYRAAGIWVPHGRNQASKAGAYIEPNYSNALLG
jgi:hypothetical protein